MSELKIIPRKQDERFLLYWEYETAGIPKIGKIEQYKDEGEFLDRCVSLYTKGNPIEYNDIIEEIHLGRYHND